MEIFESSLGLKQSQNAGVMEFNLSEWRLVENYEKRGSNGILHRFDYALISSAGEVIPVNLLNGPRSDRIDTIVLTYFRAKDLGFRNKYVVSSQVSSPYENFLSGIFSVPILKGIVLKDGETVTRIGNDVVSRKKINNGEKRPSIRESVRISGGTASQLHGERHRRDHTKIVQDILELAESYGDVGITRIIYKCNLNYNSAQRIINELLDRNLLQTIGQAGSKQKFKLTESGQFLLKDLRKLGITSR
ncbi:MAG: winged helix-turn-helix domain-containing protein [Thermoplasmataceae archaeon]